MHVVFRFFQALLLLLFIAHGLLVAAERVPGPVDAVDAAALRSFAAYYRGRFPDAAELAVYLKQADADPAAFRLSLRQDLLETFKLSAADVDEDLLNQYVLAETISMAFLQTGRCELSVDGLKKLCADKRLLNDFRVFPGIILSYQDPDSFAVLSTLFLWKPQMIAVFQRVKHPRFEDAVALYFSFIYRNVLMRKQQLQQQQFIVNIHACLRALQAQAVSKRLICECIDLAVKITAQDKLEDVQYLRRLLMRNIRDCAQREWKEAYVRSCLQHELSLDWEDPASAGD